MTAGESPISSSLARSRSVPHLSQLRQRETVCVLCRGKRIVSTDAVRFIQVKRPQFSANPAFSPWRGVIDMCRIAQPPRFPTPSTHDEGPKTELMTMLNRPGTRRFSFSPPRSRLERCALRSDRPKPCAPMGLTSKPVRLLVQSTQSTERRTDSPIPPLSAVKKTAVFLPFRAFSDRIKPSGEAE